MGAFLCQAGQVLRGAGVENPRGEARALLAHAMGCAPDALLRDPRAPASSVAVFGDLLRRRLAGEPMAHLLGRQGFWTLDLAVSPATLIPRPDSESLVEMALAEAPDPRRLLDLGTGTGALLLAVLAERPAAWGLGTDRVPAAVALAAANAAANGLGRRAAFVCADWAAPLAGQFDLILSNPPYIETAALAGLMPEVALFEPGSALDGGADGLDAYREICAALPGLLATGGLAVLELGAGQRGDVQSLAVRSGLRPIGARRDLGGHERALGLRLV